ncbi:MAG: NAD-dependent epimerase/dehydratase family protein [Bacteroidota bacterium]
MEDKLKILVTGGAGFIGSHVVESLIKSNYQVIIMDNFDNFYSPDIKHNNLKGIISHPEVELIKKDVRNIWNAKEIINTDIECIIHLASKPGVRKSVDTPGVYKTVNIQSSQAVIDCAKQQNIKKIIFASSSSVYGNHPVQPWHEDLNELIPLSAYAQYKLECENMGKTFASDNNNQFLSLRLFSVYGPRMRPDLAMYRFAKKILNDKEIEMYGNGKSYRDYTFIDDIVDGIMAAMDYDKPGFDIFNLGNGKKVHLSTMISALEHILGKKARCKYLPAIKEESTGTWADITKAKNKFNYHPKTDFASGINAFCKWFQQNQ